MRTTFARWAAFLAAVSALQGPPVSAQDLDGIPLIPISSPYLTKPLEPIDVEPALQPLDGLDPLAPSVEAEEVTPSLAQRIELLESDNARLNNQIQGLQSYRQPMTITRLFRKHLHTPRNAGVFGKAEYLRWAYRQPGLEYGITDIGGVQDRGAVGSVLSLGGEYDNGMRASIGYRFDQVSSNGLFNRPEMLFTYTEFDTELFDRRIGSLRSSFITSDNSENDDSDNINTLGVETITPDDRATSATARMTFDYDVYDLEFAQSLQLTRTLTWRLSAGARAAVLNEHFGVTYTGGDFQVPYRAFRDWDYSGAGVLFGSDFNWKVKRNFSLNFGAKTGALLGRYESRHFFPDDEPGVPTDVRHGETRVNPFIEVNAGVQYERQIGKAILTVGAGYEIVNWFNMTDSRTFTDSHMEGQNAKSVQDVSLDGMYARLGINY